MGGFKMGTVLEFQTLASDRRDFIQVLEEVGLPAELGPEIQIKRAKDLEELACNQMRVWRGCKDGELTVYFYDNECFSMCDEYDFTSFFKSYGA